MGKKEFWWQHFKEATCMPDRCFCEGAHQSFIRQPLNTFSNLAFLLVALKIWNSRSLFINSAKREVEIYSLIVTFLGLTSMFYHSGLTFLGQWIDNVAMYVFSAYAFSVGFQRLGFGKKHLIWIVMAFLLGALAYITPDFRREIFAISVLMAILGQILFYRENPSLPKKNLYLTAGSFLQGLLFWFIDQQRIWCPENAWISGHALWHGFSALSCYFFYKYYFFQFLLKKDSSHP